MKLGDLDFEINSDLIALRPKKPRDESKLLISEDPLKIIKFKNIIETLRPGDVLVVNDTKVIRSDITGYINESKVSINLNKIVDKKKKLWSAFIRSNKKIQLEQNIYLKNSIYCKVIEIKKEKEFLMEIMKKDKRTEEDFSETLALIFKYKAVETSLKKAEYFVNVSYDALAIFPDSEDKRILQSLTSFSLNRSF